jgi:hypothetical protein
MIAFAAEGAHVTKAKAVVGLLERAILFPLMTLLTSVALLVFLWGMYEYVAHADEDTARSEGKKHMLYGIIGLLVMISAYGILRIAAGTFGVPVP